MSPMPQTAGWMFLVAALAVLPVGAAGPETQPAKKSAGPVPSFSPGSGVFAGSLSVKIAADEPGADIRFTLDGSEPSAKSEAVGEELKLTATTLVRARIFKNGRPAGPVASQTYTVTDNELEKFTSNLPIVIINTFGREIERERRIPTSVRFIDVQGGASSLLGQANFDGRGDIKLRGHTSLRYLKRSFSLKTRDDAGRAQSVSILGFPADSDWVLYAPYPDKTLLRDVLAYDLSRQMGRYASRTRFVEVFLNQIGGRLSKRYYMGVYVLEEKIKRGKDRVNIHKLGTNDNAEPNITGGYIFKKDHWDDDGNVTPTVEGRPGGFGGGSGRRYGYPTGPDGFPADPAGFLPPEGGSLRSGRSPAARDDQPFDDGRLPGFENPMPRGGQPRPPDVFFPGRGQMFSRSGSGSGVEEAFRSSRGNEFFYVEPEPEEITPAQKAWLQNHLAEFERVLYGPNFKDPVRGYAAYIDVDSFIDHHLIVELTKNIDGFRFSTFFHKDRGGKIKMEPIWDWNLSFGNANGKQGHIAEYWYWPQLDDTQYSYFRRLYEDRDFGQRYVDRLAELRAGVFSNSNLISRIDALVAELGQARVRNFQRWPILSRRIWPNTFLGRTYEDEINYMKDFLQRRLAWIDRQFVAVPEASKTPGSPDRITLTAPAGKIYFTTDSSDPRAAGGSISSKAVLYSAPVALPGGGRLFARALVDERWSAPLRP